MLCPCFCADICQPRKRDPQRSLWFVCIGLSAHVLSGRAWSSVVVCRLLCAAFYAFVAGLCCGLHLGTWKRHCSQSNANSPEDLCMLLHWSISSLVLNFCKEPPLRGSPSSPDTKNKSRQTTSTPTYLNHPGARKQRSRHSIV